MDWIVLGYLLVINYLASIIQGVTTFGDAIVLHILWDAMTSLTGSLLHTSPLGAVDIEIITVLMYSRTVVLNLLNTYLAIRSNGFFLPYGLLAAAAVPQLISTVVGEKLLISLPKAELRFWFGIGLLGFAAAYMYLKFRRRQAVVAGPDVVDPVTGAVSKQIQVGCCVTSLLGGIAGALTGVGGPPWMIFILAYEIPSSLMRLLYPVATLPATYVRFGMAIADGLISMDMVPYHAVSIASGALGVVTGYLLGKRIGPKTFNVVVLVLIVLAALVMLITNPAVTCPALLIGVAGIFYSWFHEQRELGVSEAVVSNNDSSPVEVSELQSHHNSHRHGRGEDPRTYDECHHIELLSPSYVVGF